MMKVLLDFGMLIVVALDEPANIQTLNPPTTFS